MTKFWFTPHTTDENCSMRVWLDGWPGDMFEVLSPTKFAELQKAVLTINSLGLGHPVQLQEFPES
jgi:hypothetical protein